MPQNPQRPVHTLLGTVELEDSLAKKDIANFCTQLNFWQSPKKHGLPKRWKIRSNCNHMPSIVRLFFAQTTLNFWEHYL